MSMGDMSQLFQQAQKMQKEMKLNGSRRAYRIPLKEIHCQVDETAHTVKLAFTLPPGSYATMLLEQLMGVEAAQGEVRQRWRQGLENARENARKNGRKNGDAGDLENPADDSTDDSMPIDDA